MSIFDHTIQFIVPASALALAREINRALDDDDVGGAEAYQTELADGRYTYSRPCTVDYAQLAAMLFAAPEILHSVIEADYAKRWPDLTLPTYEQCVEFCSLAECYVDDPQQLELKPVWTSEWGGLPGDAPPCDIIARTNNPGDL